MKFLLDVCVSSRSLQAFLVGKGHDVVSAVTVDPKASDERLLALAFQEDRALLTEWANCCSVTQRNWKEL